MQFTQILPIFAKGAIRLRQNSRGMKRRKFYKNTWTHCYQRTADGGVLFYTYSDHLVYFTHYCILARKHHIRVLAMCQMPATIR